MVFWSGVVGPGTSFRSLARASRSLSRYALKSSTCEQVYTYFSFGAKCWLRGGVGGQFHRNLKDQLVRIKFLKTASWVVDKETICCFCVILKSGINKRRKKHWICYVLDPGCNADFQL